MASDRTTDILPMIDVEPVAESGRRRFGLATRIAALTIAVAAITAIVAGLLSVGLVRSASESQARRTLGRIADAASAVSEVGSSLGSQTRVRNTLRAVQVQFGLINPAGRLTANDPLVTQALTETDIRTVLAGRSVSARRHVTGGEVFLEARPTKAGGLVVVQRRTDALAVVDQAIQRVLIALAIGLGVAVVLGLLVAYRIARPLRRTAAAAHALADGRRDVTVRPEGPAEVAEVGRAVNTLAGALSQSEARQREFLMSVSHDLRTPLTAVSGYAESLADGVVPAEQTAEVGEVMLREARRLDRLVSDLLDLARLDAQEFRVDFAEADLVEVVRDAGRAWTQRCAAAGVVLKVEAPGDPIPVVTDVGRLRQVLDGLVENALRITPSAAPIVVAARVEPGGPTGWLAVLEVRDGGPGLTDDDLGIAFERSVLHARYRAVRQVGTGLGLAIVRGLVGRLQATIEAGHAQEGGARFTVRMPVRPVAAPAF